MSNPVLLISKLPPKKEGEDKNNELDWKDVLIIIGVTTTVLVVVLIVGMLICR